MLVIFETMFSVWFWLYGILPIIGNISFGYFVWRCKTVLPSKDTELVNRLSKKCIVSESLGLAATMISIDVYCYLLNT